MNVCSSWAHRIKTWLSDWTTTKPFYPPLPIFFNPAPESDTMQALSFSVWLISLSVMSSCPSMLSQMQEFLGPLVNRHPRGLGWNSKLSLFLVFLSLLPTSSPQSSHLHSCPFSSWRLLGHPFHYFPPPNLFCLVPSSSLQMAERRWTGQSPLEATSQWDHLFISCLCL